MRVKHCLAGVYTYWNLELTLVPGQCSPAMKPSGYWGELQPPDTWLTALDSHVEASASFQHLAATLKAYLYTVTSGLTFPVSE